MENQKILTDEPIILHFEEGIYGFEDIKEYILLQEDELGTIWYLQAAHDSFPCIVVIDPLTVKREYQPILSQADQAYFHHADTKDLCFLCVAALKEKVSDSVINLKSPIVIDVKTKKAKQVILENDDYPIRQKLFEQTIEEG